MDRRTHRSRSARPRRAKSAVAVAIPIADYRIPRIWTLPWGYRVRISQVSKARVMEIAGEPAYGCWDAEARTIYLDRTLALARRCYTLTHEAVHAIADWQHWALNSRVARH